ncbi:MAG TPA: cell cycle transcriptional regulator TrcR [Alphaproteobacteria bacterium]|nr:cell cycle transcriptional regulator TrcR [Alphaproteobacteria bacterium]
MAQPLMPKATAVWLVENTTLTFRQIAGFCGLHELEVQAIADGEVAGGMQGLDPVANGQLTKEEVAKGEADPNYDLQLAKPSIPLPEARTKGARYTPVAKRSDRPDAIAWLLKNHPELSDAQISRLVGTTKNTIAAVRDRTHWNTQNIRPQSPVLLGLCAHDELEKEVHRARDRLRKAAAEKEKAADEAKPAEPPSQS